jgi:cell filamentation protein
MSGSTYNYIDSDYIYSDPRTGVLRNKANIDDAKLLIAFESMKVSLRLEELQDNPIRIKASSSLLSIHRYLFQDVYNWAGQVRTVEISKGGKQFFPTSHFPNAFAYIDTLIAEYRKIGKKNKLQIAHKLAEILDTINFLHPFREGNGRTQREFIRLLALEKGLSLNLNPPDSVDVYNRYMSGTIEGNVNTLTALLQELIEE